MIRAYIDGGARGNPGPAGFGARLEDMGGRVLAELHGPLGIATNNVAEYSGLIAALEWALAHGHTAVQVRADSELLVKQMRGEYRIKHPGLQPLAARARDLAGRVGTVTFQHVRREQNKEADRLSNLGMDEAEVGLGLRAAPEARIAGTGHEGMPRDAASASDAESPASGTGRPPRARTSARRARRNGPQSTLF